MNKRGLGSTRTPYGVIEFLILLISRSMEPIFFASSTIALAMSSIF